jgi:2-polyprenyl-3-methyl-5-hydroxy-6-metoxy-1,4-benzoquinol methylase
MSSTIRQVFDLPKHTPVYIGRQDFVVTYAAGKSVLHLGCADAGFSQQKFDSGLFLHARLQKVAKSLWGVDVDTAGLDWMSSQGWQNLYHLDIERLETEPRILAESFDLLVLTEVLEHLNNPGRFLEAIRPLFHFQTELLISTPNATSLSNIIANLHHQESVHPEHNFWFSYHTLGSMLNKYGYQIRQFALYSQYDYTQPWIGKFLPSPARVHLSLNLDRQVQPARVEKQDNINGYRRPKIGGWLRANTQAVFYGLGLKQWPFFADGILAVVCLAD